MQVNTLSFIKVGHLQYASPATVSRCGMVFVDPKNLRYTPYWQKWIANRPDTVGKNKLHLPHICMCVFV